MKAMVRKIKRITTKKRDFFKKEEIKNRKVLRVIEINKLAILKDIEDRKASKRIIDNNNYLRVKKRRDNKLLKSNISINSSSLDYKIVEEDWEN